MKVFAVTLLSLTAAAFAGCSSPAPSTPPPAATPNPPPVTLVAPGVSIGSEPAVPPPPPGYYPSGYVSVPEGAAQTNAPSPGSGPGTGTSPDPTTQ